MAGLTRIVNRLVQELSLDELMPARGTSGDPMKIEIADWSGIPEDEVLARNCNASSKAPSRRCRTSTGWLCCCATWRISTEETAQVLDLNADAVKTRLHRARLLARKKLDGYLRASSQTVEKN